MQAQKKTGTGGGFCTIIAQIVLLDIVFSVDSVITAIGLTDKTWVIVIAVIASFAVLLVFAKPAGDFILKRPSLKILARIYHELSLL